MSGRSSGATRHEGGFCNEVLRDGPKVIRIALRLHWADTASSCFFKFIDGQINLTLFYHMPYGLMLNSFALLSALAQWMHIQIRLLFELFHN